MWSNCGHMKNAFDKYEDKRLSGENILGGN